jgi:hypothetical protein
VFAGECFGVPLGLRPSPRNCEVAADSDDGVRPAAKIGCESAWTEPNFSVARAPAQDHRSTADTVAVTPELPEPAGICAICGRVLWSDGLPPARDGDAWICGDCDQARNTETLGSWGD